MSEVRPREAMAATNGKSRMNRLVVFVLFSYCQLLIGTSEVDAQEGRLVEGGRRVRASSGDDLMIANCRVKLINDIQLASEQPGVLAYVPAEGAKVQAGERVVQIRDNIVRAAYAVADKLAANDVEVRYARKATDLAQLTYLRATEANKRSPGTVSELELRELRLLAEKSLLQLEQAKQQFLLAGLKRDETREQLQTYRVATPFDGVVLNVYKQVGEVVREGDPILEVASTDWVRVEGYLPLAEAHRVEIGTPVTINAQASRAVDRLGQTAFSGKIGFVGTKVEPLTKKVRIWATVANRGGMLRDGMTAAMTVSLSPTRQTSFRVE